ncbi:MAG TPA: hypothetical protein VJX68_02850 [Candidatus Binatus sp.]|uniref:hypothetical protein n=1 Tax=Candidatus Binatus sp. TaxID=2811406 RepID=UPI002B465685|nr:hypothetical protein [Candidatus Binatus sp.]HKN12109.1 hypothetical protein [Candidatus Binatus sp.]
MELPWKRKLPNGETLYKEAERLGLHFDAKDKTRDADLQQRVLVAWAERRNAIVNYTQTFAIVGTLLITLGVAFSTQREQRNRESADLMLKFEDLLPSGRSAPAVKALEMDVGLHKAKDVDDEAIDEFLGNYELLDAAYRHGLISADMAHDAFEADLETALKDGKVRRFITDARTEDGSDMYDGVLDPPGKSRSLRFPLRVRQGQAL